MNYNFLLLTAILLAGCNSNESPTEKPDLPEVPVKPELPDLPEVPVKPELPDLPEVPVKPELPDLPEVPVKPELPDLPQIPVNPEIPERPVIYPWHYDSGDNYISEHRILLSDDSKMNLLHEFDINIINSEPIDSVNDKGYETYQFDDISFSKIGADRYEIINKTPMKINEIIVDSRNDELIDKVLLRFNKDVEPFTKSIFIWTGDADSLEFNNQFAMYLPVVTLTGDVDAETGASCIEKCYSVPDKQQASVYKVLSSNIHNSLNNKNFIPDLMNFYKKRCENPDNSCDANVAIINVLKLAVKNHNLYLKVLSGDYLSEGVGGGGGVDLDTMESDSSGWASIWFGYITESSPSFRPYDGKTYKTMFHEGAHAYGFNHASGMTYGFSEIFGFEFIQNNFTEEERLNIGVIKHPNIVATLIESKDRYVKFRINSVLDVDMKEINARVMSPEVLFRKGRFSMDDEGLYYELIFDDYPTEPLIVQFYSDNGDYTASVRVNPNLFYSYPPIAKVDNLSYYELPRSALIGAKYSWANSRCSRFLNGSKGATKSQIHTLWSNSEYKPSLLSSRYIISSDMSVAYSRWQVDMTILDSFMAISKDMYTLLSNDEGFLCVRDNTISN
ncbi:hypothetical protein [Photobacterium damselae]|uniref:hypothetical protein n=1 Tax=Photobacterium damselae TaxID=38293 RepID=UPI000E1C9FE9|nr:hypothetical protein [Photobacterium damselae]RDL29204.1 hypothetical protein BC461_14890 [Photobacterium damselae]